MRANVVLAAAARRSNSAIAAELAIARPTVILWRKRMAAHGLEGISDATRPGRRKTLDPEVVARIVDATLNSRPEGGTHWSIREMAAAQHVSPAAVQRIWRAHGLKPHLVQHFKLSADPHFEEKLRDIVGLYLASTVKPKPRILHHVARQAEAAPTSFLAAATASIASSA
jgi:transposase